MESKQCENKECVNNVPHDGKKGSKPRNGPPAKRGRPKKVNRKQNQKLDKKPDVNEKKIEKVRRPRSKVVSDISTAVIQRRSPRNTPEAREARAESKKLKLKGFRRLDGEDLCAKLPIEKQALAALILSEINRKRYSVFWKP